VASREAGPLGMMVTLAFAGMLSGATLVGVFTVTGPRIERNRAEALERAVYEVLPGAVSRQPYVIRDDAVLALEGPDDLRPNEEAVWAGYDAAGGRIGFAIPTEGGGFQDTIRLIYGVDPARRVVVGMRVLESKETPGLGDKIIKDDSFVHAFDDLAVDPAIEATKKGATEPWQVDAIAGATISSKAVVSIVNDGNERWLDRLPTAGSGEAH
jgi:Na+-translocating ferredoxin:NAD+ oxidoreductase subunit G